MTGKTPRILAVANQKGGVGKTTTAVNLGTALASLGQRVLVVDLDPQGNASTGLGIPAGNRPITTYHVLSGTAVLSQAAVPTSIPNLFIVPANSDLVGFESENHDDKNRPFRLRDALMALQAQGRTSPLADFNYVLIDCPPSLNLLTLNAMVAAQAVLVPVQCEFYALEGISQLKDTIDQIKGTLNPTLDIQGVVLTMYDGRLGLSKDVASEVRAFFGAKVYETMIPRNVRLAEAPSFGKPIILYDYDSPGSQAYIELSREILKREGLVKAA